MVSYLIDTLRYKRQNDDWRIKPGTILRCDTAISDKTFESACFVSIPTLHASPSDASAIDNNPETCRERKLHEAFDQTNVDLDEYSSWPFKTGAGGGETHKFWVRQTWFLITKSGMNTMIHSVTCCRERLAKSDSQIRGSDIQQSFERCIRRKQHHYP